jgi:hypothetical protein
MVIKRRELPNCREADVHCFAVCGGREAEVGTYDLNGEVAGAHHTRVRGDATVMELLRPMIVSVACVWIWLASP